MEGKSTEVGKPTSCFSAKFRTTRQKQTRCMHVSEQIGGRSGECGVEMSADIPCRVPEPMYLFSRQALELCTWRVFCFQYFR
jgi:hypothetical protein